MTESYPKWSPEWRTMQLLKLDREWSGCQKCPNLVASRNRLVLGAGNPKADIVIIGEMPGVEEDRDGVPFVGASGQCLESLMTAVGAHREDFFLTNLVACVPPDYRSPTKDEINNCLPRLYAELYIVDPMLIIAAGATAQGVLIGARGKKKLTDYFGKLTKIKIPGKEFELEYDASAMYNPAYILRNDAPDDNGIYPAGGAADLTYRAFDSVYNAVKELRTRYDQFAEIRYNDE